MPSSLAEPHNYIFFSWRRRPYCLRVPLSLITIEQKQALTVGTRRAALMSVPRPPLLSVCFFSWQMAERSRVNPILTTQHHILFGNDGMLRHGIFVQTRLLGWFSGGDVSVTIVSVLFCSESRFHSGHLHALIPAANCTTLFFFGRKNSRRQGTGMFVRRGRPPVCLECMF